MWPDCFSFYYDNFTRRTCICCDWSTLSEQYGTGFDLQVIQWNNRYLESGKD